MIIRLKVFEQTLSIADTKSVPRKGSKDYLVLQFTFSSDWKDLDKLCYLQRGEVSQPIDVVDGLVEVPEWFTEQDSFDVTLFGKIGTQEVPTNVVSLRLEKSNTLWEQNAPEPQPSWLAKVIDLNNHPSIPGENGYWLIWDTDKGAYVESKLPLPASGSGGTSDHSKLINRDAADQHPMSAVTGLVKALEGKQPTGDYLTQDNLQSATNAALAQAKASGEFDGTDGITPHIGDNGNWYLGDTDTGKPSRGEAGAGMDITGAAVGQIAKITAVDDSGKPTAWEAVDMPSGGSGSGAEKTWSLLLDETLSEDTAYIFQDLSAPVTELIIEFLAGGDGTHRDVTIFNRKGVGYGANIATFKNVLRSDTNVAARFVIHCVAFPDLVFFRCQFNNYNNLVGENIINTSSTLLFDNENGAFKGSTNFDCISIGCWSGGNSGVFKAGTKVKVYGKI